MNNISNALHFLLAIFAIWYLLICWSEYRLDVLRQRLFAVRDDLFLAAAKGEIEFSNSAYVRLRMLMNGTIRYAHRFRIPQMFVSWLAIRPVARKSFLDVWNQDIALLPEGKRALMQDAHRKMQLILARHLNTSLTGVLLSCLCALLFVPYVVIRLFHKKPMNVQRDRQEMLIRSIRPIEDETYMLEMNVRNSELKLAHS
jgi:hypothetical protein